MSGVGEIKSFIHRVEHSFEVLMVAGENTWAMKLATIQNINIKNINNYSHHDLMNPNRIGKYFSNYPVS